MQLFICLDPDDFFYLAIQLHGFIWKMTSFMVLPELKKHDHAAQSRSPPHLLCNVDPDSLCIPATDQKQLQGFQDKLSEFGVTIRLLLRDTFNSDCVCA